MFELAHEGTLFLDEIGEISMDIQLRFLRALEQREVFRLGGEKVVPVDIRVIAATNKNLWQMVKEGKFREMCIRDRIPTISRIFTITAGCIRFFMLDSSLCS